MKRPVEERERESGRKAEGMEQTLSQLLGDILTEPFSAASKWKSDDFCNISLALGTLHGSLQHLAAWFHL